MTIGKSSKKSAKSPKFLDLASGFYGRLDETEPERGAEVGAVEHGQVEDRTGGGKARTQVGERDSKQEPGVFDFNQGMLEDDGTTTLLRKRPSRRSSRWRRKSSSKKCAEREEAEAEPDVSSPAEESVPKATVEITAEANLLATQTQQAEQVLIHFAIKEEADDQVLISEKAEQETEGERGVEEMKLAKSSKLKNYRKALDRALRRGWETFITNLYSVTLTPISSSKTPPPPSSSSSSSSSSSAKVRQSSAIAEYR
ncbi:hypothetical protein AGOR_G00075080 [Albula goreensis]|uniref:Uncharacterized protein n=1 Tax=Albula goreensis TaxID=1534307 RepID=A0A8T3DNR3_9TELE|nr:hypothetical protein AGOR_G00075080 [Albula goreensis]